jgi:hypothetical protein
MRGSFEFALSELTGMMRVLSLRVAAIRRESVGQAGGSY